MRQKVQLTKTAIKERKNRAKNKISQNAQKPNSLFDLYYTKTEKLKKTRKILKKGIDN